MKKIFLVFFIFFVLAGGFFKMEKVFGATQNLSMSFGEQFKYVDWGDSKFQTYINGWNFLRSGCGPAYTACIVSHAVDLSPFMNQYGEPDGMVFTLDTRKHVASYDYSNYPRVYINRTPGEWSQQARVVFNKASGTFVLEQNTGWLYVGQPTITRGKTKVKYYQGPDTPVLDYLPDEKKLVFNTYSYMGEGYDNFTDDDSIYEVRWKLEASAVRNVPWLGDLGVSEVFSNSPQISLTGYDNDNGDKLKYSYHYNADGMAISYIAAARNTPAYGVPLAGEYLPGQLAGIFSPKVKTLGFGSISDAKLKNGAQILNVRVTDSNNLTSEKSYAFSVSLPGKVGVNIKRGSGVDPNIGGYVLERQKDGSWQEAVPGLQNQSKVFSDMKAGLYRVRCAPADNTIAVSDLGEKNLSGAGSITLECAYNLQRGSLQVNIVRPAGMSSTKGAARILTPAARVFTASTTTPYTIGAYTADCSPVAGYSVDGAVKSLTINENQTTRLDCVYGVVPPPPTGRIEVFSNRTINYSVIKPGDLSFVALNGWVSPSSIGRHTAAPGVYAVNCPVLTGFSLSATSNPSSGELTNNGILSFRCDYTQSTASSIKLKNHQFIRGNTTLAGTIVGLNTVGGGIVTKVGAQAIRAGDQFRVVAEAKDTRGNTMNNVVYIWKVDGVEKQRSANNAFVLSPIGATGDVAISVEVVGSPNARANITLRLPALQDLQIE